MKVRLSLSLAWRMEGGTATTIEMWIGTVESITLVRAVRPAHDISSDF
jgi:hypothetical protein